MIAVADPLSFGANFFHWAAMPINHGHGGAYIADNCAIPRNHTKKDEKIALQARFAAHCPSRTTGRTKR